MSPRTIISQAIGFALFLFLLSTLTAEPANAAGAYHTSVIATRAGIERTQHVVERSFIQCKQARLRTITQFMDLGYETVSAPPCRLLFATLPNTLVETTLGILDPFPDPDACPRCSLAKLDPKQAALFAKYRIDVYLERLQELQKRYDIAGFVLETSELVP